MSRIISLILVMFSLLFSTSVAYAAAPSITVAEEKEVQCTPKESEKGGLPSLSNGLEFILSTITNDDGEPGWLLLSVFVPLEKNPKVKIPIYYNYRISSKSDVNKLSQDASAVMRSIFRINNVSPIQHIRPFASLSPKLQAKLRGANFWPSPNDLIPAPGVRSACPNIRNETTAPIIDAILYSCGGSMPSVICDCGQVSKSGCGGYKPSNNSIVLCDRPGCNINETLVHELIHALQQACAYYRGDWSSCDANIKKEFMAYVCAGQCSSIVECCFRASASAADDCFGGESAMKRCMGLAKEDPEFFQEAQSCCPNTKTPNTLPPCGDSCYKCSEPESDKDGNGICDWYQCRKCDESCLDQNEDGINDLYQPVIPEPTPVVTEDCDGVERTICTGSPGDREKSCQGSGVNLVCCQSPNCGNWRNQCWTAADSCDTPAMCYEPPMQAGQKIAPAKEGGPSFSPFGNDQRTW